MDEAMVLEDSIRLIKDAERRASGGSLTACGFLLHAQDHLEAQLSKLVRGDSKE